MMTKNTIANHAVEPEIMAAMPPVLKEAIKAAVRRVYEEAYSHGRDDGRLDSGCSRYIIGNVEMEQGNKLICELVRLSAKLDAEEGAAHSQAMFDRHAAQDGLDVDRGFKNGYRDPDTRAAWRGWKLALAALASWCGRAPSV
jgi:hypothetical protein